MNKEDLKKHANGELTDEELSYVAGGKGDPQPDHDPEYAVGDYARKDLGDGYHFTYIKILGCSWQTDKYIYTIVHASHDPDTNVNKTFGVDNNWEEGMFGWNKYYKCDASECSSFFSGY